MTVAKRMNGITPNPSATGIATADDYLFAIDFSGTATDPNDYIVAEAGVTELSGAMSTQTQSSTYLRTGETTTTTGHSKAFALNGDRYRGDDFQEALLDHKLKWGTGSSVVKPYVYFDMVSGKGEKGETSINVEGDFGGGAGSNAGISGTLNVQKPPAEYEYAPPTP